MWKVKNAVATAYAQIIYFLPTINHSLNNWQKPTSSDSCWSVWIFNLVLIFLKETATNQSWQVFLKRSVVSNGQYNWY